MWLAGGKHVWIVGSRLTGISYPATMPVRETVHDEVVIAVLRHCVGNGSRHDDSMCSLRPGYSNVYQFSSRDAGRLVA